MSPESGPRRHSVEEDSRLATEAVRGNFITAAQLNEARAIQEKFSALGLAGRNLGEIFLQRGYLSRIDLRELYRRISPDVDLPVIGGYQVVSKVGEGGMGAVYEARQLSLDRKVALKILHPALAEDELYLKRFVREARAVALLNHANIVGGIDVGHAGKFHYFVMEFVEGKTVKEMLREEGFLPEKLSFEVARQVGLALDQASRHGLVHRDIKPENVILTEQNVAKLCDLGLARPEGIDDSLTESGATHGTPFYMSPEQACGESLDVRSDIYALGVTLYEMVTGERPFSGRTAAEVLVRQISEDPIAPRKRNGLLSVGAERVILKMMAKRPAERYQEPRQLVKDLEDVICNRMPKGVKDARLFATHKVEQASAIPAQHQSARRAFGMRIAILALATYGVLISWKAFTVDPAPNQDRIVFKGSNGGDANGEKSADPDWRARRLYLYALAYAKDQRKIADDPKHPDHAAMAQKIRSRFQQVVDEFTSSYWAFQARDQLDLLDARARGRQRNLLNQLRQDVRELCQKMSFAQAFERVEKHSWPAEWGREKTALDNEIQLAASRELEVVLARARAQQTKGKHIEAIALVEGFLARGLSIGRAGADQLLLQLRSGLAKTNVTRREASFARLDRLLFEAFTQQQKALRRYRIAEVQSDLEKKSKRTTDARLARRLRWLGSFLGCAQEVLRAAEAAFAAGAKKGMMANLRDRKGTLVAGRLESVEAGMIVMQVGDGQRTVSLADQPAEVVLAWAEKQTAGKPSIVSRAAFLAAAGRLLEAQQLLEARDHLFVELIVTLRRHTARRLLRRYRELEAEDKPHETLAALQELIARYGTTDPVLDNSAVLMARRRQLKGKLEGVRPLGKVITQERDRFKLRYDFVKRVEREDWGTWPHPVGVDSPFDDEVKWITGYLLCPGRGVGVIYRYRTVPPMDLRFSVSSSKDQKPGVALWWKQEEGASLKIELGQKGLLTVKWDFQRAGRAPVVVPVAVKKLTQELLPGISNIRFTLQANRLSLQLDGQVVLVTALKQKVQAGRLLILAPAGALRIREITLDGTLQPQ